MFLPKYSESDINDYIKPWSITQKLGEGASAEVFEITCKRTDPANHSETTAKGALKVITIPANDYEIKQNRAQGMSDEDVRAYYCDVADQIISTIHKLRSFGVHENIVLYGEPFKVNNPDRIGWTVFVPMERLYPLDSIFPQEMNYDRDTVIRLGIEICRALQVCHAHNLLHRDIKPANILVDAQGNFKLGDFGIAKVKEETITDISARGTENYMAPEIIRQEVIHSDDFTADLYSLGLVMFELLNDGRLPGNPDYPSLKTTEDNTRFLMRKMTGNFSSFAKRDDSVLLSAIAEACEISIGKRYQSAAEMERTLEVVSGDLIIRAAPKKLERKNMTFGRYAGEPITWIILEDKPDEMLLLSEKILDAKEFHAENTEVSWEGSTLRSWLNGYDSNANDYGINYSGSNFISETFRGEERKRLIRIGGDWVSLLAANEVYETEQAERFGFSRDRTVADPNRMAAGIAFAIENGLNQSTGNDTSVWWLRTSATERNRALFVDGRGIVCCSGGTVFDRSFGVRPIIRLSKR